MRKIDELIKNNPEKVAFGVASKKDIGIMSGALGGSIILASIGVLKLFKDTYWVDFDKQKRSTTEASE